MKEDFTKEVIELLSKYKKENIRYAKPISYLLDRNKIMQDEVEREIFSYDKIVFVEKQKHGLEVRYRVYYLLSSRKGRVYVLSFDKGLVIITIFTIGRRTLLRYKKKGLIR